MIFVTNMSSTWFRDLVEAATGLHTGNERDWDLRDMSEWTLMQSGNDHQAGADLLVKSHHMRFSRCSGFLGLPGFHEVFQAGTEAGYI